MKNPDEIYRMHQEHPQDPCRHWHERLRGWQPMNITDPERLEMIQNFNARQCRKLMALNRISARVRMGAARRLRTLNNPATRKRNTR